MGIDTSELYLYIVNKFIVKSLELILKNVSTYIPSAILTHFITSLMTLGTSVQIATLTTFQDPPLHWKLLY